MSVVITDVLPISTTYQSCSPAPCGLNAGNVISWSVGTLGVREAAAVTLLARVNSDVVFCYSAAFRAEEITEGLGITDAATISRFRSACKALLAVGLFTDAGEGRYTVNQAEVSRLRALAGAMKGKT